MWCCSSCSPTRHSPASHSKHWSTREGLMWALTGWIFRFVPIPDVRLSHWLVMWLTWGFIIHHVYSAWMVDREERSGEISSMFSGWKNLPRSRVENAPELTRRRPQ